MPVAILKKAADLIERYIGNAGLWPLGQIKEGETIVAIAAIMAMTIIISIKVNPALFIKVYYS